MPAVTDWRTRGACSPADTALFFSLVSSEQHQAKRICATCLVRRECLEYVNGFEGAGKNPMPGIWGGYNPKDRIAWRKRENSRRYRERKRKLKLNDRNN
jgi:WhiB family transcriptional regulator, redox-sensing transcriptional regulator